MELRFELPELKLFDELYHEFQLKVALPFNRAFAEFKTLKGAPCFQISEDTDRTGDPIIIASGRLSEIEADYEDPMYFFDFNDDGTAYFMRNHAGGEESLSGSYEEILARVFLFIKGELKKIAGKQGKFADELSKVEAAMALLAAHSSASA